MDYFAPPVERLIEEFAKLPGIGQKTAQRLAFHVLDMPKEDAERFADAIREAKAKTFRDFLDKMLDWAAERTDLFDLLEYTRQVLRTQGGFPRSAGEAAGAVQILSIHGAKGLEFPVVIVARMGARFSVRDKRAAFLLHDRLGISADEVDEVHRRIHPTMLRELAEYAQQKEQRSEIGRASCRERV